MFRRDQQRRSLEVREALSLQRDEGEFRERQRRDDFTAALSRWEDQAADAERMRTTVFLQALDSVRGLQEGIITDHCLKVSRLREELFLASHQRREKLFLDALINANDMVLRKLDDLYDHIDILPRRDDEQGMELVDSGSSLRND